MKTSMEKIRVEKTFWPLKTNSPIRMTKKNEFSSMRLLVKKSHTIHCTFIQQMKLRLALFKATAKGWTYMHTSSSTNLTSKVHQETLIFLNDVLESIKPSNNQFLGGNSLQEIEAQTLTTIQLQGISITMDKRRSSLWCTVRMVAIILLVGNMGRLLQDTRTKWIAFTQCPNNMKATNIQTTKDNISVCSTKTSQTWPTLDQPTTRLRNPAISQAKWQGGKRYVIRAKTQLKSCTSLQLKGIHKSNILSILVQSRSPQLPNSRGSLQNNRLEHQPTIKQCKTSAKKSGLQPSTKRRSGIRAQQVVFISWQMKPSRTRLASRQVSTIMRSRTKRAIKNEAISLKKKETIKI